MGFKVKKKIVNYKYSFSHITSIYKVVLMARYYWSCIPKQEVQSQILSVGNRRYYQYQKINQYLVTTLKNTSSNNDDLIFRSKKISCILMILMDISSLHLFLCKCLCQYNLDQWMVHYMSYLWYGYIVFKLIILLKWIYLLWMSCT